MLFVSFSKKFMTRRAEGKEVTNNADRKLFDRLMVMTKSCHIDVGKVPSSELTNVQNPRV